MNKSDYTPIAMRGGIGDILLYTLKVWGNGFWKYFFISFLFLIPLFLSINLFNIIVLPNITSTEEVANSIAESSESTEEITNEISASNKSKIDINSNILFYVYTTISILIITYFLCLSIGANSYITGKYSVGEDTSISDALAYSFKRTGSYLIYTLFITAISLIILISFISLIELSDNYTFYKEALNWISMLTGLIIIFLLPLLLLVFPAMIFMKTNLFKALKGVISLSKQYYSREFSIILIGLILCLFSWGIINNYTYTESLFSFGSFIQTGFSAIYIFGIIFLLIMTSILYSIITSLISQCFLNVWACKLGLENIYAIKILSASLNGKKIPKSWYKNRPIDKLQEKDKAKKQNRQTKSKNNKKTTSSISGQSREKFRKKNKSETS